MPRRYATLQIKGSIVVIESLTANAECYCITMLMLEISWGTTAHSWECHLCRVLKPTVTTVKVVKLDATENAFN
jgi:hypothetical protein